MAAAAVDDDDDLEERMLRAQLDDEQNGADNDGDVDDAPRNEYNEDDVAADAAANNDGDDNNFNDNENDDNDNDNDNLHPARAALQRHQQQQQLRMQQARGASSYLKLHYSAISMLSALALVLYALRTRGQAYLALTYLTSSKLSYVVLGNAVVAAVVSAFQLIIRLTLSGLRPSEAEHIGENVRWNVTETCIALTIFRSEVDVNMGAMFLTLVSGKCLHWAVEMRGSHLRMTEEVFYFVDPHGTSTDGDDSGDDSGDKDNSFSGLAIGSIIGKWLGTVLMALLPKSITHTFQELYYRCPRVSVAQMKFLALVHILLLLDCMAMAHCGLVVAAKGPSVHILFGFEAAILTTSALSTLATYGLHIMDGWITVLHHIADPSYHIHGLGLYHDAEEVVAIPAAVPDGDDGEATATGNDAGGEDQPRQQPSTARRLVERISSSWRDRRATLSFTIELAAHALRFLFYLLFFAIVFTYYGMPINIFREVYVSYQQLRQRLTSFANYRRLTANMNERFEAVRSDEELDEVGRTCIICRDGMKADGSCKKLPGCGHCFHAHCLREWLVQQQSCPTCRGDIQANEARVKAERAAQQREEAETEALEEAAIAEAAAAAAAAALVGAPPAAAAKPDDTSGELTAQTVDGPSAMDISSHGSGGDETAPSVPSTVIGSPAAKRSFPCLYRVTAKGQGATILSKGNDGDIVRVVPPGKIILCTEIEKQGEEIVGTSEQDPAMLSVPDGWVMVSEVERVRPLVPMST
mmetsp:Transcript_32563/g.70464  ORF Transcript_32563/g.70464 Transcript_32563/m.70464 type:complete len:753 (-) Transcript_32563:1133-3391(-)